MQTDYISREAAKKEIRFVAENLSSDSDWMQGYKTGLLAAMEALDGITAADVVEVKRGKWKRKHTGNGWDDWDNLTCPECGEHYRNPNFPANYCPNCGADMRGWST